MGATGGRCAVAIIALAIVTVPMAITDTLVERDTGVADAKAGAATTEWQTAAGDG